MPRLYDIEINISVTLPSIPNDILLAVCIDGPEYNETLALLLSYQTGVIDLISSPGFVTNRVGVHHSKILLSHGTVSL